MTTVNEYETKINALVDSISNRGWRMVTIRSGRKFDKIVVAGKVRYFVNRETQEIYGAKGETQVDTRRFFFTLDTIDQIDWTQGVPLPNSSIESQWNVLRSGLRPRGRPRKNPTP